MALAFAQIARLAWKVLLALGLANGVTFALQNPAVAADISGIASTADGCASLESFAPAAAGQDTSGMAMSKSDAILGGAESALDRIRNQQAGLALPTTLSQWRPKESMLAAPVGCSVTGLLLPSVLNTARSLTAVAAPGEPSEPVLAAASQETFLATQRVAINRTAFSETWDRVAEAQISGEQARRLLGATDSESVSRLQAVNRWVNRNIAYGEDRDVWSRRDYWASAKETIAIGRGDCEDLAILKYQILVALGVDRRDLYLTLARDLARNADHAVLIVRQGGTYYLLDNATDAILPANVAYDYRPTLSFNSQSAWLHGSVARTPQLASASYLSVSAISRPRVIGLNR